MVTKAIVKVDKRCAYHQKGDNTRCESIGSHPVAPGKGLHTFYFCDTHFPTAREAARAS